MEIVNVTNVRRENNNARSNRLNHYVLTLADEGGNEKIAIVKMNYGAGCVDGIIYFTNPIDHTESNGWRLRLEIDYRISEFKNKKELTEIIEKHFYI